MQIRYFAAAAAATGLEEQHLDLTAHAGARAFTLADLSAHLVAEHPLSASAHVPALAEVLTRCSFLLNEAAAGGPDTVLAQDDVVDVLPPFAGG